jgi:hypothetical protein
MNEQILKDFIATAQKYNYNWNTVIPKFPELKNYDPQLLKDYVATAEKYNYDYAVVNSKFPEFGFGKPKKKEPTVLPSASAQEPSLSATQPKKKQQPSVSSSGGGKIYKGYPNKESKEYFLKEGVWYERPNNGGNGWTPITDRNRIKSIYDFFVNKSDYKSASESEDVFTGFEGKEDNQYRVSKLPNGKEVWEVKRKGQSEFTAISNKGSISALNREFGKNVEYSEDSQKLREAQVARTKSATEDFRYINSDFLGNEEEDAVTALRKAYGDRGFNFSETGKGDAIRVTADNGKSEVFYFDNWTDKSNNSEAIKLRAFLSENQKLGDYVDEIKEENKENQKKLLDLTEVDFDEQRARLMAAGSQAEFEKAKEKNVSEFAAKEIADKSQAAADLREKVIRGEYTIQRRISDLATEAKTPEQKEMLAAIAKANKDGFVQRHNIDQKYLNDLDNASKILQSENAEYNNSLKALNAYIQQNQLTEEDLKTDEYASSEIARLEQMRSDMIERGGHIISERGKLGEVIRQNADNAALYMAYNETRGSVAGGILNSAIKGFFSLPNLEEFGDYMAKVLGSEATTEEFMQSEDRLDITKAAFSVSESIGALASTLIGGGLTKGAGKAANVVATQLPFFSLSYNEIKGEMDDPKFANVESWKKEGLAIMYGLSVGYLDRISTQIGIQGKWPNNLAQNYIFRTIAGLPKGATADAVQAALASNIKKDLAAGVIKTVGGSIVEGSTEAAQSLAGTGLKQVFNWMEGKTKDENGKDVDYFDLSNWTQQLGEEFYMGMLGGAIMNVPSGLARASVNGFKRMNPAQMELYQKVIEDSNLRSMVITDINAKFMSGQITREEAQTQMDAVKSASEMFSKLPDDLTADDKAKSIDLLIERSKIEKQIEGKEENLVAAQKERIKEINTELQTISQNAVQKQTAGEVPVQPEARVGEEVEEGKPEAEPQVVTEEGQAVEQEVTVDRAVVSKNAAPEVDRIKSVAQEAEDGVTLNLDGTKYEGGGLVVPVDSKNVTAEEITPEMIADFLEENVDKIGDPSNVKIGLYKFPNSNQVSIDLNIIAPSEARDAAIEFGKKADQESLFDLDTLENIKTGGTGMNTVQFTPEQFKEISKAFSEGRVPNVFDQKSDLDAEVEAIGEIVDSTNLNEQTEKISEPAIRKSVSNAVKALTKIAPNVKFIVHKDDKSYRKATGELGRSQSSSGTYNHETKEIHINLSKANARTVAHETFHAILLSRVSSDTQAAAITKRMINAISAKLESDSALKAKLDEFASNYEENIQNEEKLAELIGYIAENYESQPETIKDIIKRWLNKIAEMVGLKKVTEEQEVLELLDTIGRKVATGKKIKERDVSRLIPKSRQISNANRRFQADFSDAISKLTFVYDKNTDKFDILEKDGYITRDKSLSDFEGKIIFLHQPDAAFSGAIYKDGELLVEGKGGVFYPIKFHEDGYFWASTSTTAKGMADNLNKVMEQNGGTIYMALTSAPSDKLFSSTTMSNAVLDFFTSKAFDNKFKVNKNQVRLALIDAANSTAIKKTKNKKGEIVEKIVGLDLKIKKTESIESVISKIRESLSPEVSSFLDRKNFSEEMAKSMADIINSSDITQKQFSSLFSEGIQNKYFKGIKSAKTNTVRLSKANIIQALGEMFTEPMLKEGVDRDKGGQVYAILELNGPVKPVKSDKHESYPMAIQSADQNNKVKLHLLTDRQNWFDVFEDFETNNIVTKKRRISVFPTSGVSVRGLKLNTSGISDRKQLPEKISSKLTEDGNGNYVFQHWSSERRKEIKPGRGENAITGKDEARSLNAVDGLAMFYTMKGQAEQGVGNVLHTVVVPKDKVYDAFNDPEGFEKKAREEFEKVRPGQSFDDNYRAAFITKVANDNGYDIAIYPWRNNEYRAQTTLTLKPEEENIEFKEKEKEVYKVGDKVNISGNDVTITDVSGDIVRYRGNGVEGSINVARNPRLIVRKQFSDVIDRKQEKSASSIVSIARKNGFSEKAIAEYLRRKGFDQAQIDRAMSINDDIDVNKIFDRSKQALLDKNQRMNVSRASKFLWNKIFDRQSDIKKKIASTGESKRMFGIGRLIQKDSKTRRAHNLLINRAGAKGYSNFRYKEAEKIIYKGLSKKDNDALDKLIYARRIISINENRANLGMEAYRGIDGYSEAEARRDIEAMMNELGDKKFADLSRRADVYFDVFAKSLENLYKSGRITEETYNNLKDVEYSPIATIKYIIGDNVSVDEIDRQAELYGITRKDIMTLTDSNENEIIMDSKWLLMMNLMSVEARAWENKMLTAFADAVRSTSQDTRDALSEYIILDDNGKGTAPAGFKSITYFVDGDNKRMFVRNDMAKQLLDVKNRNRGLETIGNLTGTKILRFFATGGNPLFIIGNTAVDFTNVLFMSDIYSPIKVVGGAQLSFDFLSKFLGKIIKSGGYKKLYEEYMTYGGGMDFLSNDGLRELNRLRPGHAVTNAAQKVLLKYGQVMSYLGETSEQAMRLAVFGKVKGDLISKYKKENGGNDPKGQDLEDILLEAARESRETIDFSQGGDWAKSSDLVMPYLNASLQGFRKPLDYATKNPAGFASSLIQASAMAGGVAYLSISALANSFDDDDEEDKAEKIKKALASINDHEKAAYHIIFTGKRNKDGEYEYYRVKKLPFLSVFTTAAEQYAYKSMIESLGGKYDMTSITTAIDQSIPFSPTDVGNRNPVIAGLLTYHFNRDMFTGEEVFRMPEDRKIKPEAEGMYDDKVQNIYKWLAPKLGLSPIRSQAFVEKIITSPSTNPSVSILYGITSGLPIKDVLAKTMNDFSENVEKKMLKYTNKDILKYAEQDETEKMEIEIDTEKYLKEEKIKSYIKKKYEDGGEVSVGEIIKMVEKNFDPVDREKYVKKYYNYIQRMDIDGGMFDIIYETDPEVQAMKIFRKYGSTLDNEELKDLMVSMKTAGVNVSDKTMYFYRKNHQKTK